MTSVLMNAPFETRLGDRPCVAGYVTNGDVPPQTPDIFDPEKHELLVYYQNHNHGVLVRIVSTHPDVDCGEIARTFGGRGSKSVGSFAADYGILYDVLWKFKSQ